MIRETDLPCPDCDATLTNRTVRVDELRIATGWRGDVDVAECADCGAWYYPDRTLRRLANESSDSRRPCDG